MYEYGKIEDFGFLVYTFGLLEFPVLLLVRKIKNNKKMPFKSNKPNLE